MNTNNQLKGFLYIMLADFLWGLSAAVAKHLFNRHFSPIDLTQIRVSLAFIILAVYLAVANPKLLKIERKDVRYVVILGIFGLTAVQFFYYYTISETNVATAVFLEYLAPIFILLYGLFTRTEKAGNLKLLSLAGATLGGLLIVKGTTGAGLAVTGIGLITGLGSALAFAFYSIYGKYGLSKYSSWTLLMWGMGAGGIAWAFFKPPWITFANHPPGDWMFFIYIAVFATIIPYGFFLKGLGYLPPLLTGITSNMEPVVAGVLSYFILGEVLTPMQIAGCTMIILAVILLQFGTDKSKIKISLDAGENNQ